MRKAVKAMVVGHESISESLLGKAKYMEYPCEAWGIATDKLGLLGASQKKIDGIECMRDGNQEGQCCAFEMPGRSSPVKELKEEYLPEDQQKPWKSLSFTVKSFPLGKVAYKLHKMASWQPYEIF